jgi:hypothetical protein
MPYKDDQDRESVKPRSSEATKSGSDNDAAHSEAAFNPQKTRPGPEKEASNEELEVSGANQQVSKPRGDAPQGNKGTADKSKKSGVGSAPKNKSVKT